MARFSSRFATWLIKAVFSGMENSPPALSSYRHARLVECGIDTQAGNKNRLSHVMFCLRYVRSQFNTPRLCRIVIFLALYHPKDRHALKYR